MYVCLMELMTLHNIVESVTKNVYEWLVYFKASSWVPRNKKNEQRKKKELGS